MIERPFLFEATRMIATHWAGRSPTGIDRVCHAYLRHFGPRAQAVVQHRGMFRILSARHSDELFAMLGQAQQVTRAKIAAFAMRAWFAGRARADGDGAVYLNVSHTDFDLPSHARWVRECRLRPIYFLHDLIPITHARYCTPHAAMRHRGRVMNALRTAAGIIVNSRSTAHDLRAFAGSQALPLPPLAVAPLAIERSGKSATTGAHDKPYFLCLGTIEERKNHRLLLDVWLRLIAERGADAPQLVIIGQWGARSSAVRAMWERHRALRRHVTIMTRCNDEQARDWIAGAQALLMPTLAEGFGLPMVEGLAIGTPVIASDLPCFHEIGQGIPCLLDPSDTASWTQAITRFSEPGGERKRQLCLLDSYSPPVWDDHFAAVEAWLADMGGEAYAPRPLAPARSPQKPPRSFAANFARRRVASTEASLPPPLLEAIETCP